ncbi:MAG: hypothetical protein AABZ67_00640 [Pseudomonadota bacterium]
MPKENEDQKPDPKEGANAATGADEQEQDGNEPEAGDDEQDELSGDEGADLEEDDAGEDVSEDEGASRQVARAPKGGASETIRALRRRAQQAETERDQLRQRPQAPQETEEQERQRVALMTADEKIEHYRAKDRGEFGRAFGGLQQQMAEQSDVTKFEALCARNPTAAKLADAVEEKLAEMRAKGQNAARDVVLKFLIGDRALARNGLVNGKAKKRAAEAVERERGRAASPRGDARAERRRGGDENTPEARAKRLENVLI